MTVDQPPEQARRLAVPPPRVSPEGHPVSPDLVVVGVDGSERSVEALVWALQHAAKEHLPVLVVTAWPLRHRAFVHEVPGHFNDARWEASEAQARAIAQARSLVARAPRIESSLVNAPMLQAILALARPERLVVLGTDRDEPRTDGADVAGTASLTSQAQRAATGPVLLVPRPAQDDPESH